MKWKKIKNNSALELNEIVDIDFKEFRREIIEKINDEEKRIIAYFGIKEKAGHRIFAILGDDTTARLYILSSYIEEMEYEAITCEVKTFHMFERELYEETGIVPVGHPWLKPVRYSSTRNDKNMKMENYQFFQVKGEEVHEVGVGPIHAGVIEPGHFRFMCHGEKVYHLEIQLGYQHRNIETIIKDKMNENKKKTYFYPQMAEQIAGDTAAAHANAYAMLMESLLNIDISKHSEVLRGIMLELERIAVHIGDIGAILNDIGFMMGNAVFGAMRTNIINTSLLICGSRFGKGFIKVGGVNYDIDSEKKEKIKEILIKTKTEFEKQIVLNIFDQPSVLTRLEQTGILTVEDAKNIGMTGVAARASGIETDIRTDYPYGAYKYLSYHKITSDKGDVFARTYIRYVEVLQSIDYIFELLNMLSIEEKPIQFEGELPVDTFGISISEGWRGEIIHIVITDEAGKIAKYKIIDPSFNNWYGLAVAVRNNEISDFPLCNKSFNLSYSGHDL